MKFILFLLFFPILSFGQQKFELSEENTVQLHGTILKSDILLSPFYMYYYDDYILIHNDQTEEYHYDILDVKTGKIISRFCKKGRGPGEVIFPKSIQILPERNEVLVYDLNAKKVNFYSLDKIMAFNTNNFIRSFRVDSAYPIRVILLQNDCYLGPLVGDDKGYKYCRLDEKGSYIENTTLLPDIGKNYPTIVSGNLFNYRAETNRSRDKIVMAYDHWDRIDVMDDVIRLHEIEIEGPKHKIPDIFVNGQNMTIDGNSAIYAYQSPSVGDDSFFVLYSGDSVYDSKRRKKNPRIYKYALQFDFSGNLLNTYHLDPAAHLISVDWDANIIYGINMELEPTLIKYKF